MAAKAGQRTPSGERASPDLTPDPPDSATRLLIHVNRTTYPPSQLPLSLRLTHLSHSFKPASQPASAQRTRHPDTMASTSQPHDQTPTQEPPKPIRRVSALEVDDESPSPSPVKPTAQRSALGVGLSSGISSHLGTPVNKMAQSRFSSYRPSMSSLRSGRIVSRRVSRAVDGDDEDGVKLPSLVPGIRAAYSTPLPMLPMVVLCIVRCVASASVVDTTPDRPQPLTTRPCCPSFCPRTCLSLSCLRWWKVCLVTGYQLTPGFFLASGKQKSSELEAAVGFWTGELQLMD